MDLEIVGGLAKGSDLVRLVSFEYLRREYLAVEFRPIQTSNFRAFEAVF